MSRGRKQIGAGVAVLVVGAVSAGLLVPGWNRAAEADDPDANWQNAWQWRIKRAPGADRGSVLRLLLRSTAVAYPAAGPGPARTSPLRTGDERVLGDEPLGGEFTGRVGLQLIDTGSLGLSNPPPEPFRMAASLQVDHSCARGHARLGGHSVQRVTRHPAAHWANHELPLLTVATIDRDKQYTYTFFLRVERDAD